ncbi:hypothetical protein AOQ84DRAFT_438117 [Glonium stellatum]|uniref:Uncharacterized protein n=1 Tax=Glonium stellatum TaxID=574774 RepID=A0A8E2F624_9PEZI|nr:hypothetical protein AOQ84DRAFT_438117 [Glonium stellatum]
MSQSPVMVSLNSKNRTDNESGEKPAQAHANCKESKPKHRNSRNPFRKPKAFRELLESIEDQISHLTSTVKKIEQDQILKLTEAVSKIELQFSALSETTLAGGKQSGSTQQVGQSGGDLTNESPSSTWSNSKPPQRRKDSPWEESNGDGKRSKSNPSTPNWSTGEKGYGCPLAKLFPDRYTHVYNPCTDRPGFKSIGRVVEHLKEAHRGCLICQIQFTGSSDADIEWKIERHRADLCHPATESMSNPQWLTPKQEEVFALRAGSGTSIIGREYWDAICRCLGNLKPEEPVPSPWYDYLVPRHLVEASTRAIKEEEQEPTDSATSPLVPAEPQTDPSWTDSSPLQNQPHNWRDSTSSYDELHSTFGQAPDLSDGCTHDTNSYPLIDAWNDETYCSEIFPNMEGPSFSAMPFTGFQLPSPSVISATTSHQKLLQPRELTHRTSLSSMNPWAESAANSIIVEVTQPNVQSNSILPEANFDTHHALRPQLSGRDSGYGTASARSSTTSFLSDLIDSNRSEIMSPSQTPKPANDPYSRLDLLATRGSESSQLRSLNIHSSTISYKSGLDFCKGKRLNPFRRAHSS